MKLFAYALIAFILTVPAYSAATNEDCLTCHMDKDLLMVKNGKKISIYVSEDNFKKSPHGKLNCVSCHTGFNPYKTPHREKITAPDCRSCHKDLKQSHFYHPAIWKNENIGKLNCNNCHENIHYMTPVKSPQFKFAPSKMNASCGECHTQENKVVSQSGHKSKANGAFNCLSCHNLMKSAATEPSANSKGSANSYCIKCHINNEGGGAWGAVINPDKSIHGANIKDGGADYPSCVQCHGTHEAGVGESPSSKTNSKRIFNVCGKCHVNITTAFYSSTHGLAVQSGNKDAPSCKHCHFEHNFKKNLYKQGSQDEIRIRNEYCFPCHQDKGLAKRNNLKTLDEGHEWLSRAKLHLEKVDCADCHSSQGTGGQTHDILLRENAIRECNHCHSGNTKMITSLMLEEKSHKQKEIGFWKSIFSGDSYVKGTSRNLMAESISWILFILFAAALIIHAIIRLYFSRNAKKVNKGEL